MVEKLTRALDKLETDLLRAAANGGYPVGGVLDETLEMLCNSYGLLEQDFWSTEARPLGNWQITETGHLALSLADANVKIAEIEADMKLWRDSSSNLAEIRNAVVDVSNERIAALEAENARMRSALECVADYAFHPESKRVNALAMDTWHKLAGAGMQAQTALEDTTK